jgi:hypothetical protein
MQPLTSHSYITVVPAYRTLPTASETFSLVQLKKRAVQNITLVCPNHLDVSAYLKLVPDLRVVRLSDEHFLSVQSYNSLMLQPWFYAMFAHDYRWMLVHQLDAFLLENQINAFCELGYDYYGAPWLSGFPQYRFAFNRWPIRISSKRFNVGNGGLSLRNISKTIDLLSRKKGHVTNSFFMEDAFFGYWGTVDNHFRACPKEVAATFSLESHPEYWLKQTGRLPMGFHGYGVWSPEFYKPLLDGAYAELITDFPHIPSLG